MKDILKAALGLLLAMILVIPAIAFAEWWGYQVDQAIEWAFPTPPRQVDDGTTLWRPVDPFQ